MCNFEPEDYRNCSPTSFFRVYILLPDKHSIQIIRLPEPDKFVGKLRLVYDATHKLFLYISIIVVLKIAKLVVSKLAICCTNLLLIGRFYKYRWRLVNQNKYKRQIKSIACTESSKVWRVMEFAR